MADDEDDTVIAPAVQPTVDAGTVKGRNDQKRELELRERERREFWSQALGTVVGRREIWAILAACHPFEVKFGMGPSGVPDPQASFMALGQQMIGLNLFLQLQMLEPVGVQTMLNEHDPRFKKPDVRARAKKSDQM